MHHSNSEPMPTLENNKDCYACSGSTPCENSPQLFQAIYWQYDITKAVADPRILKQCISPVVTYLKMHIINYTRFIREIASYWKKWGQQGVPAALWIRHCTKLFQYEPEHGAN